MKSVCFSAFWSFFVVLATSLSQAQQHLLPNSTLSASGIQDEKEFESMAGRVDGIIKSATVKFLIDNRNPQTAKIQFINGNFREQGQTPDYARFHYDFATRFFGIRTGPERFNAMTYFTNSMEQKKFIAGSVQRFEIIENRQKRFIYGIQFYPQDHISEGTLLFAAQKVAEKLQFAEGELAVILYGSQQTARTVTVDLQAIGVRVLGINDVLGSVPYIPMNSGEAWGYIRLSPPTRADQLKTLDIALFKELPLDLSVVAGVITEVVQDAGSHVNLKSKERNTPNIVVRDEGELTKIKAFANKPVHLVVRADGYEIKASTDEEVREKFIERNKNKKWKKLESLEEWNMMSFDQIAKKFTPTQLMDFGHRYGGKAAKLALLAHRDFLGMGGRIQTQQAYRLTPIGFGVPMSYYTKIVSTNPKLKGLIDDLINAESVENGLKPNKPAKILSSDEKIALIAKVQNEFYVAKLPADFVKNLKSQMDQLQTEAKQFFPKSELKKVKIRSSANAEDIKNFDGAGLHDSFGAKIKEFGDPNTQCTIKESDDGVETKREMQPETVLCAVRGVYASLWNKRAIKERSFARILPDSTTMGLAINQSYDFRDKSENINEIANAVIVTRILNTSGIYGYQMSLNVDDNLVTNPTPNTQSEINLATFIEDEKPSYTITQFAKPKADQPVMTSSLITNAVKDRIIHLVRVVEKAYCKSNPEYYKGDCAMVTYDVEKKQSLDLEVKIYSNGEVLVKQVREFSGQ